MAHALLGHSGSSRWLNCPPSARLEQLFENVTTAAAEEGTVAHALGDILTGESMGWLTYGEVAAEMSQIEQSEYYNSDMLQYIEKYNEFVMDQFAEAKAVTDDAVMLIEQRLDVSEYVTESFGTGDRIIISDDLLYVTDLKYGRGVRVSAKDNSQLKLYALGCYLTFSSVYDFKRIRATIYQPRMYNIVDMEISVEELLEWAENTLKPVAALAWRGEGDFNPGSHCTFCRVQPRCRAYAQKQLKIMEYIDRSADLLTDQERADILPLIEPMIKWGNGFKRSSLAHLLKGGNIPGYKLVRDKSSRKFTDEAAIGKTLTENLFSENEIYTKKLIGITLMEKLLGKKNFEKLIGAFVIKPPGAPTLAPESDARAAISSVDLDFEIMDQEIEDYED